MEKVISPNDWDFGEQTTAIVKMASGGRLLGSDYKVLVKRAGEEFASRVKDIEINDDQLPVHVIAMGATEGFSCFAARTPIAMAGGKYRVIERIQPGDLVLTADGNVGEVTTCFTKTVDQGLRLTVSSLVLPLTCTSDHPFRVARFEQFTCLRDKYSRCLPPTRGKQNICARYHNPERCAEEMYTEIVSEWAPADSLRVGDFLVWTCPNVEPEDDIEEDEAYLMGAWLAEGSYGKNPGNKQITSLNYACGRHEYDEYALNIHSLLLGLGYTSNRYDHAGKSTTVVTGTHNVTRVRKWHEWFGQYSNGKRVPPWMCCLPEQVRMALVAGYFDGDGHFAVSHKENRATARTASLELALGMQRILWSLGVPATVCPVVTDGHFNLSFPTSYMPRLDRHAIKFESRELKQTSKVHGFWYEGRMYLPVRAIADVDHPFQVYNFEVEGDHTYSGPNVDSHNCNRNGDGFKEAELKKCHKTFEQHAKVYRNHKNKDPEKSYGQVKYSFYNDAMRRVELLLALNKTKEAADKYGGLVADKEQEILESGESIPVSMATRVPFDSCSSCGNKAKTRADYCDEDSCVAPTGEKRGGCKHNLTRVHEDGHVLHVDNPNPDFFDISSVFRPADRIAYGGVADYLQKAASGEVLGGAALAEAYGISAPLSLLLDGIPDARLAHQIKLAYQLAELEEQESTGEFDLLRALDPKAPMDLSPLGTLGSTKMAEGLAALASQKVALPLRDFLRLAGHKDEQIAYVAEKVARALPGVYQRLISSGDLVERIRTNPFTPSANLASSAQRAWAEKLARDYSLERRHVQQRLWKSAIYDTNGPAKLQPSEKQAEALSEAEKALAQSYALYKLAFLSAVKDDLQLTQRAIIQQNYRIS